MANEVTATVSLAFAKGNINQVSRSQSAFNDTVSGDQYFLNVQNIGTSEEALSLGDFSGLGWAYFRNLDATNYVELAAESTGDKFARIPPGKSCCFRLAPAATLYATANGSAVNLEVLIVEE